MATAEIDMTVYTIPLDTPVVRLEAASAFSGLSKVGNRVTPLSSFSSVKSSYVVGSDSFLFLPYFFRCFLRCNRFDPFSS